MHVVCVREDTVGRAKEAERGVSVVHIADLVSGEGDGLVRRRERAYGGVIIVSREIDCT